LLNKSVQTIGSKSDSKLLLDFLPLITEGVRSDPKFRSRR